MSIQHTGGSLMADMLAAEGVQHVFGIIDGTYLMFFSSCVDRGMHIVTPRHEATALHMAGAYARIGRRLGVAMASNGPGVANALGGVTVEQAEGNRVLLITSSRRPQITYPDRGGAYQCFDQVAAIRPISKWSETVRSADRLAELMHAALRQCYRGRPGVVHLDVPETIVNGATKPSGAPLIPAQYRHTRARQPASADIDATLELLRNARLPALQVGSGAIHAGAHAEVAELSRLLHAPVTTSWSARGVIAEDHPLVFPIVHIDAVNAVRNQADLVLCLGSDLGETDWWGKPPYWRPAGEQTFIQVDIDETILGRNHPTDLAVLADVRAFLQALIARVHAQEWPRDSVREQAVAALTALRDKHRQELDAVLDDHSVPMLTAQVASTCNEVFPDAAIAVIDGGNTAVWSNFYIRLRAPNSQLGTHHFGHLGAGPGQALGAAIASPERPVFCIIGDGAMGFHPQEVETAVRHGLKVVFLVCCDRQWGMVKLTERMGLQPVRTLVSKALGPADNGGHESAGLAQAALGPVKRLLAKQLEHDPTINADLHETEFDKMAQAMGAFGARASTCLELRAALEAAIAANRCAVIHVDVDPEKHLWAPGLMHFKNMHQEPRGR